jgi:uncharacterized protein (UPF0333 family)
MIMKKFLKLIFLLLFLTIILEISFLFFFTYNKNINNKSYPQKFGGESCFINEYEIVEGINARLGCCMKSYIKNELDRAFMSEMANFIVSSKKGLTKNLKSIAIYEGRVSYIGKKIIKSPYGNDLPIFFKVEIIDFKTGKRDAPIFMELEIFKKANVKIKEKYNKEDKINNPEDITKYIKVGDYIRVNSILDYENNRLNNSYEIEKL